MIYARHLRLGSQQGYLGRLNMANLGSTLGAQRFNPFRRPCSCTMVATCAEIACPSSRPRRVHLRVIASKLFTTTIAKVYTYRLVIYASLRLPGGYCVDEKKIHISQGIVEDVGAENLDTGHRGHCPSCRCSPRWVTAGQRIGTESEVMILMLE